MTDFWKMSALFQGADDDDVNVFFTLNPLFPSVVVALLRRG